MGAGELLAVIGPVGCGKVRFTVGAGELLAVIGPVGCGKVR